MSQLKNTYAFIQIIEDTTCCAQFVASRTPDQDHHAIADQEFGFYVQQH